MRNITKSKQNGIAIVLIILGLLLFIDDTIFNFLPDMSALDGYNDFLQHWMAGIAMLAIGGYMYAKQNK